MSKSANAGGRFIWLDLLRGRAAISVVAFHVSLGKSKLLAANYLWVDFFFILSGFVLCSQTERSGGFLRKRAKRLFPIAIIALFGSFSFQAIRLFNFGSIQGSESYLSSNSETPLWSFVAALLLLQVAIPVSRNWIDALWSLSSEWWSIVIAAVFNIKESYLRLAIAFTTGFALTLPWVITQHDYGFEFSLSMIGRGIAGFSLGLYLRTRYERKAREAKRARFAAIFFVGPIIIWFIWANIVELSWITALPIYSALVWLGASMNNLNPNRLVATLAKKSGELSFGIYAFHQLFQEIWLSLSNHLNLRLSWPIAFVFVLSLSAAAAEISRRRLEPLFRRLSL